MYSKVSKNTALIDELKSKNLARWRNYFAHNAFMHEFMNRTSSSPFEAHPIEDITRVIQSVCELLSKLSEEIRNLQVVHKKVCGVQGQD